MKLQETTVKSHVVYRGRIITLCCDDATLPDGRPCQREFVRHPGGAGVLLVRAGRIALVRQYRYAYGEELLEIPAGKLDTPDEDPAVCAARELSEETGWIPRGLIALGTIYPSPGYTDELLRIFLCLDAEEGKRRPDDGEYLRVEWYDAREVLARVRNNTIRDAKTVTAVLRYFDAYANQESLA